MYSSVGLKVSVKARTHMEWAGVTKVVPGTVGKSSMTAGTCQMLTVLAFYGACSLNSLKYGSVLNSVLTLSLGGHLDPPLLRQPTRAA